ncbi:MAG: 5-(carboxyamino)imidazole ribonucleotide synthase [Alphaproteobacteria bacterium]
MDGLVPGDTIGILGGGQLGRMLARAASRLGLRTHIYCQSAEEPACDVAAAVTLAPFDDTAALQAFAQAVRVVTYEFENVPAETVSVLETLVPVRPGPTALAVAQDRFTEKTFLNGIGVPTTGFAPIDSAQQIGPALGVLGTPAVLKSRRFGYDGKGQTRVAADTDHHAAWDTIGRAPAILEAFVPFTRELSVIVARSAAGTIAAYDVCENQHRDHILARTLAPARLSETAATAARAMAGAIVDALDYVGVMGVELFETAEGAFLVNEIAPRVHNSGHWTLDACVISQFEQHIRAVAGWPLGTIARHSDAVMVNLIGEDVTAWREALAWPDTALHLYGKRESRRGRKMGHATTLYALGTLPADL